MATIRSSGVSPTGIETFELTNQNGLRLEVITYGARLHRLFVPTKKGEYIDVLAGFDDADGYRAVNPYFNAAIGRSINRIRDARFTLNGKTYLLCQNEGKNCLHGGKDGLHGRLFTPTVKDGKLRLSYLSRDGEENFPGNLTVEIVYDLTEKNELVISYEATTDEDTLCNLTNHAYFNLDGDFRSCLDMNVYIRSHKITEADEQLVATGKIIDVTGTAFDFTTAKPVGRDIDKNNYLFRNALGGYDFNYILDEADPSVPAATAYSDKSGIKMTVYTDRPCLQFYSGNFLDGTVKGKCTYNYQSAFCFESQGYPNACNIPSFPSNVLRKGETFRSTTKYLFTVE